MYSILFLPIAKKDINDILFYMSIILKNKKASQSFMKEFIKKINSLLVFPYGEPVYDYDNKLHYEYRCLRVKNYLLFYVIDESKKTITISRILYNKTNIYNFLD